MDFSDLKSLFFEEILQICLKSKDAHLIKMEKRLASEEGENFFSEVYRIFLKYTKDKVKAEEETMSLIVKVEKSDILKKVIHQFFSTELKVLKHALVKVENYVGCTLGPRLVFGNDSANFIVMEDLAARGFATQDRQKGLSLSHCLIAIENLAKFHAGSVALVEEEPDLTTYFLEGMVTDEYSASYFRFLEVSLSKISEGVAKWNDGEYVQAAYKLKNIVKTMKPRLLKIFESDPDELCVLNHGDYWTNNILFKSNEKDEPCEALMIDYQMSIYASPAIDLHYFLCVCPEFDIKCDKDDYFLEKYLTVLESTMKTIGCKTKSPTMEQIKKAMYKRRIFTVFSGLIYYPIMVANKGEADDFSSIILNGESKIDPFKNPNTVKALRKIVKALDMRGYLD